MSLDTLYETDPITYIKYNLVDVILVKKLNDKLKHIELHSMLRRDMKTPLMYSIRGSSALFDTFFSYDLEKYGKYFRSGIIDENIIKITEQDIKNIPRPKEKSTKWTLNEVDSEVYLKILNKFEGAYVKNPIAKITDINSGINADLDASSLYPLIYWRTLYL